MPKILIVDDEPAILNLLSAALSGRGFDVHAASTPKAALEAVKATPNFDLVVSDVIMPGMCGPALVGAISQICPGAAIVLMSGHTAAESLPEGVRFIGKPFQLNDFYSVVETALQAA